ncbi:MAG: acetylserotonin O-methyltransferase [Methanolinea sp.]|nr:acetylserotonin O-methyltransferase [Methanolinea sp.]
MQTGRELFEEPSIEPGGLFNLIDRGMQGLAQITAVQSAVNLSLFDHLAIPMASDELANMLGTGSAVTEALCSLLSSLGLLSLENGRYRNTPLADLYLVSSSPYHQSLYVGKTERHARDFWMNLPRILKEGPVTYPTEEFFGEMSLPAMAENALCGRLQRTVREIVRLPGFPAFRRMIDLGGGHGLYAIALARANPELMAWVFDLPYVTRLTERYISEYDAADRVFVMPGNFFINDFGKGYDLVFSSSNPSGKRIEMVPRISSALNPGGVFVNVQSLGHEPADPALALESHLWALSGEEKEKARTRDQPFMTPEYRKALEREGLSIIKETDIRDDYHRESRVRMVIAEKDRTG